MGSGINAEYMGIHIQKHLSSHTTNTEKSNNLQEGKEIIRS